VLEADRCGRQAAASKSGSRLCCGRWRPGCTWYAGWAGAGKTTLALEAAFTARQAGARVWSVSAADLGALEAGMRAVGRRLGIPDDDLARGDAADLIWAR
jgi:hypothetical protein